MACSSAGRKAQNFCVQNILYLMYNKTACKKKFVLFLSLQLTFYDILVLNCHMFIPIRSRLLVKQSQRMA